MWLQHRSSCGHSKLDLLQGTLDLMVLQTLASMGPPHGYGIARRIEPKPSGDEVLLKPGHHLCFPRQAASNVDGFSAEWGTSDNNRKAKFYSITKRGRKQLTEDAAYWQRLSTVMDRRASRRRERRRGTVIDRLRQSLQRFWSLFRRARLDQEHDAEVAAHLDLAHDENRKNGMPAEEARRQALIQLGGVLHRPKKITAIIEASRGSKRCS